MVKLMAEAIIKQHQPIALLGLFFWLSRGHEEETAPDRGDEIRKVEGRITYTFWSILFINWVLVIMGIFAFWMAWNSAAGGNFNVAALLSFLGVETFSQFLPLPWIEFKETWAIKFKLGPSSMDF